MGLRWVWNALVLLGLVVLSCGRYPLGSRTPYQIPAPSKEPKKLTLALFGAPWSADSQSLLPEVQLGLGLLSEKQQSALDTVLYVPTAANRAVPPTQEAADQFLVQLGLRAKAVPDEWQWKTFKKWIGGNLDLPAAAIVDLDGNVLKVFRAGDTSFVPFEIAQTVRDAFPQGKDITLALFGAPWCSECKTAMPAIQAELDALKPSVSAFVRTKLYVTTSANPSVPPTQQVADEYREAVHLKGTTEPDPWRWTHFRKWIGGSFTLPAAVVLNDGGEVLRVFRAGPTTFVPTEIVSAAVEAIQ